MALADNFYSPFGIDISSFYSLQTASPKTPSTTSSVEAPTMDPEVEKDPGRESVDDTAIDSISKDYCRTALNAYATHLLLLPHCFPLTLPGPSFASFHDVHIRFIDGITLRGRVHWKLKKECLRAAEKVMGGAVKLLDGDYSTAMELVLAKEIARHVFDLTVHGSNLFDGEERETIGVLGEVAEAMLGDDLDEEEPKCGRGGV